MAEYRSAGTVSLITAVRGAAQVRGGILVSIPNRAAMLVFPKGDAHYRQAMRALVREKESDDPKLLTFKLFELTKAGPVESDKE